MRFEYRFFVVDGKLVTGAACIEEYTPLDNGGEIFDIAVRENRINNKTEVEFRPDVVKILTEFATAVASEMALEDNNLRAFVLDVALDENDNPLIVERNGLLNAGLYASQPIRVTDALSKLDFD